MVWQRMGLLDDAIREHLELKRRRGADPSEVAREQHEALDPVPREPTELTAEAGPIEGAAQSTAAEPLDTPEAALIAGGAPDGMPDDPADAPPVEATAPPVGGETQELDMRTVLDDDAASGASGPVPAGDGDSLEWEMPGEGAAEPVLDEQADEDVLEETPEFLRDTPEQERLWFEQRPPRDFDFDK
jgi:hypothetical protein